MKITQLTVYTSLAGTELLAGCFISAGVNEYEVYEGRELTEAFLNTCAENWDYADIDKIAPEEMPYIRAYIPQVAENMGVPSEICDNIKKFQSENPDMDLGEMKITLCEVDEEDWANNWKQYYKPLPIGEKLMVCPSWEEVPELAGRKLLKLDPGMAFGSGLHETTRMCLEEIEKYVQDGTSLIDLGCGSGILSIAGRLMGAKRMTAVDVDPVCTEVAAENAALNDVKLHTVIGNVINDDAFFESLLKEGADTPEKYDVVVANIVAGVLIKIAYRIPHLMKKGGIFISSGIIEERLTEVTAEYEKQGIHVLQVKHMGEWCAVTATVK